KLKYLHIHTKKNLKFPKSIELLTQLKDFRVYSNCQIKIPIKVEERAQKYFIQKYLQDGVHPDDALMLANLDIIGWDLGNLEKDELYKEDPEWYNHGDVDVWDYRLNGNRRVIEIYIKPWEGRSKMPFFPEEFCFFKKLEVLDLSFYELEYIPEVIINLKSLKSLNIFNFGKKITKITKSVKDFLDSLQHLTLDSKIVITS
ncbi:unnamed protein product, partial [marine sediment metagenome]